MSAENILTLKVHARRMLTDSICEFDLRRVDGGNLVPFEAGSSLIVRTPSSEQRNYSLCNDDSERHRYVIAVKREPTSRGGSQSMHEAAQENVILSANVARHGLRLGAGQNHLLIAGGIGITPMMSLLRKVSRDPSNNFQLIYLAHSRAEAAYVEEVAGMGLGSRSVFHFSSEHAGKRFDLGSLLRDNGTGTHLYYCGPEPLMKRIGLMSIHWPRSRVHFEHFGTLSKAKASDEAFYVKQSSSGRLFRVGEDQSVLDSLRAAGFKPAASCESGTCGKCRMALVAGEPDHRDMYLTPEERLSAMMPCVSRASEDSVVELDF